MKVRFIYLIFFIVGITFSCKQNHNKEQISKNELSYVPEWSKKAIWYQIFVERFRNGDTTNDPTAQDIKGTYPDSIPSNWHITEWGRDWYNPDDYFKNSNLVNKWDNLQLRRYGGDLQGVIDELDYIQSLGITAIYFNPLNDSPSLHKYDARTWRHIDRNFGPDPKEDIKIMNGEDPIDPNTWKWTNADKLFLKLVTMCHQRGIKVIVDYSWNHTGLDFWAFKDVKEKGKRSQFADWFEIVSFDNPETKENEFKYNGWAGVQTMPEIKKDIIGTRDDVPLRGNIHSQAVKQHIFNITKRWLDPNGDGDPSDGIDGYRLDVAEKVPIDFWREYRKVVKSVNPEAYLIGEIWWKSWPDTLMVPISYLKGDVFDAIMNYRWYRPARHFFADAPGEMKPSEFVESLKDKFKGIGINQLEAMMNVTSTQDAPRTSTSLYNKTKYKYHAKPWENPDYKIDKPDVKTRAIQKMLLIHQYTFIGAPHIWYGDEIGMWGSDDPGNRKPMVWPDIKYEDETHHPFGRERKVDKVEQDTSLLNFYKKLIQIRKDNPTLIYGDINFSLIDDENRTLAYNRTYKSNEIVVAFNKSNSEKLLHVPVNKNGNYYDALNLNNKYSSNNGYLDIKLKPSKAEILIYKK